jgi:hypothetical protein
MFPDATNIGRMMTILQTSDAIASVTNLDFRGASKA